MSISLASQMIECDCGYLNFSSSKSCRRCGKELRVADLSFSSRRSDIPAIVTIPKQEPKQEPKPKPKLEHKPIHKPKPKLKCVVCQNNDRTHVLVHETSAHQGFCGPCSETLFHNVLPCPICREEITHFVELF